MNFEFFFCEDITYTTQEEGSKICDAVELGTSLGNVRTGSQNSFKKPPQNFERIFLVFP